MPRTTARQSLAALCAVSALVLAACGGHDKPKAAAPTPTSASPSPSVTPAAAPPKPTCPLTGRPPGKDQYRGRPTLAIKIDNVDIARPQSGVDKADVVIEETVEGGLTRLMAVFQCNSVDNVGPIRSARTSDSDLLQMFKTSIFGFSGANRHVNARINATPGVVPLSYDSHGALYHRSSSRPAPHNVYTSTSILLNAGKAQSKRLKPPPPLFSYSPKPNGGRAVKSIGLRWSGFASASWSWNGSAWARTQNGSPDRMASGTRIAVTNVVVMQITTRYLGLHDVLGNASPDDVVTGRGQVWVFRNGKVIHGKWIHKHPKSPLRLMLKGKVIPLAPGHTWVELLPHSGTLAIGR